VHCSTGALFTTTTCRTITIYCLERHGQIRCGATLQTVPGLILQLQTLLFESSFSFYINSRYILKFIHKILTNNSKQFSSHLIIRNILWYVDTLLGNDHEISNYTTPVARQWLSSDHVVTPTDMNATIALQQRNGVFYAVHVEILKAGLVSCCS
jgi:hypothetical protein